MKRDKTEELLLKARACDGDAFVELMELHKQSMYKVAKAYLKREEDVTDASTSTPPVLWPWRTAFCTWKTAGRSAASFRTGRSSTRAFSHWC